MTWSLPIGAEVGADGTRFRVWAPAARRVELVLFDAGQPAASHPLAPATDGYYQATIPNAGVGAHYMYRVNEGDLRPDPASRAQPAGVHGPSIVLDARAYQWHDAGWRGMTLDDMVIYELHVGAATDQGTFDALSERLDDIRALGATALELMPVADFPGERNWGYDGVCLFAPARAYGGAEALKRLVDAAHARGLAVLLDVVYNHLGPDGNYLREFSPDYFTDRHSTPWGAALNFDGPNSAAVRAFFIDNALYWAHEYHIDGLRLDATHEIKDDSPVHILAELAQAIRASLPEERHFVLIAENEHNDPTIVRAARPRGTGHEDTKARRHAGVGWGLDGVWADDFHHQVRVALTGEHDGYYADYTGSAADLAATLWQGWFYQGQLAPHSGEPRGAPADDVPAPAFVYCIQNHDQVGNRALGDRLHHAVTPAAYRAASTLLLLSPYTPLVWMGQEWAASTPFQFFTDHNPELGKLVTEGRRREFARFTAFSHHEVPDPQDEQTFLASKLRWAERETGEHAAVLRLYRDLLELRRTHPALRERGRASYSALAVADRVVALQRSGGGEVLIVLVNFGDRVELDLAQTAIGSSFGTAWTQLWSSDAARYGGRDDAAINGDRVRFGGSGALVLRRD